MHTMRANKFHIHKCPKPNCDSSFACENTLNRHLRIHNNDLDMCHYCPYRYERPNHYERHLKSHFGIKDFECDLCEQKFPTVSQLKTHYEVHEGIIYCCLICNTFEGKKKTTIRHLKTKHSDILKNQTHWEDLQRFTKTKW